MAITVSIFDGLPGVLGFYGAIQKTNTTGAETRCPLFVTLRSVDVSTFDASNNAFLRTVATGLYTTTGANELATANGYTKGGKALENARLTYSAGVLTLFADDVKWAASGGSIVAKSALLCYEYPQPRFSSDVYYTSAPLAMIDFGGTLTATAGRSLTLQWAAGGIFKWELA
jgi:hypothetical protein